MINDPELDNLIAAYTKESLIAKPGLVAAHKPPADVVRAMKSCNLQPEDITDDFVTKLHEKLPGLAPHTKFEWQAKLQSWIMKSD